MKHPHFPFGRTFCLAGLLAALTLGVLGSCSLRAVPVLLADIDDLDAKAQPHFEEARRNIPTVVEQMTEIGTTCKLCWLMACDKFAGTSKTQDYLNSILEKPIVEPCRKGAEVYGCSFNSAGFLNHLKAVNADYAEIEAYAIGGLALEAAFLKQTIAALSSAAEPTAGMMPGHGQAGQGREPPHKETNREDELFRFSERTCHVFIVRTCACTKLKHHKSRGLLFFGFP